MPITLEVVSGPDSGRRFDLLDGQVVRVGRGPRADFALPHDPALSDPHFLLECAPGDYKVRPLNDAGATVLNGIIIRREMPLNQADRIVAGQTTFAIFVPDLTPIDKTINGSSRESAMSEPDEDNDIPALAFLKNQAFPLFALLDAARDPAVRRLLIDSGERHQSLYEGDKGEALADQAPYLVQLPPASQLLNRLAREARGKAWGVFFTCDRSFEVLHKHFRHFLMVQTEQGKSLYFRFYDPRVLRIYLPTCTPEEARTFFGPVAVFLVEGETPESLLSFRSARDGIRKEAVAIAPKPVEEASSSR